MLKDVFRLPQHNEKAGCCWLCPATPDNMRDASAAAPWRVPWCTTDLVQRLLAQGHLCSPLFSLPAFTINMFKLDWLHIMDLGVAADVAGNVLWVLQGKMPGANVKMRVSKLYLQIAKYYKETRSSRPSRAYLPCMTFSPTMLAQRCGTRPGDWLFSWLRCATLLRIHSGE